MSRLVHARPAVRPALKARALLSGPPGAGKTRSALIVATLLADGGQILVIDTEKESALTYADDFDFAHLPWDPPYSPRDLADTISEAGDTYAVIVVDSLTHFWRGDGGTLDIAGGKFTGWKDARPAQLDMVEALLRCQGHFIGCARSKVEHVQEVENGRHVVRKLGMAVVQDDDLEYELNVALELDMDHSMTVSKSRTTAVPVGRSFKSGHAEDFAVLYRDWLRGGEPPATREVIEDLVARMNALPELERVAVKQEFVASLGKPMSLAEAKVPEAERLIAEWEQKAAARPSPSDAQPGAVDPAARNRKMWALVAEAWPDEDQESRDNRRKGLIGFVAEGATSSTALDESGWQDLFDALGLIKAGSHELHLGADGRWTLQPKRTAPRSAAKKAGASHRVQA